VSRRIVRNQIKQEMVGLGRVELPTNGLGKQEPVLIGFENF
jgi:hypothetical protein